ncbi:hypothetical protein FACS1894122_12610 [Alphaproteobacteria bacterium]|nr:hypothetical protein FACS1894122_12610 [Alphaproteobacteria bacterium]
MFTFKFLRPAASQTPLSKSGKNLLMNMVNDSKIVKVGVLALWARKNNCFTSETPEWLKSEVLSKANDLYELIKTKKDLNYARLMLYIIGMSRNEIYKHIVKNLIKQAVRTENKSGVIVRAF